MDDSAIKLIQGSAIEADRIRGLHLEKGLQIALPNDVVIHDLEQYQAGRRRFRGTLRTDSLSDFVGYVKRRAGDGQTPGFIDSEKLSANVLFNLGNEQNPGHADDVAKLALKPTAPYAALLAINGRQVPQKDALDWLQDWSAHVAFYNESDEAMPAAAAITAIRKITIRATAESTTTQENFRANRSVMEDVEARGASVLPSEVRFTCTAYPGLPDRTFRLRLGVLTNTDKPVLTLRVRNLEAEQEAIAQAFKRVLLDELEASATLTIGTFTP